MAMFGTVEKYADYLKDFENALEGGSTDPAPIWSAFLCATAYCPRFCVKAGGSQVEDETERRGKTFLGAGGKILSSIAKAITGSGQPSRSIMRDVAGPTAAPPEVAESKPAQGTLDSISQAIVVSTREAQWNRAKDGKIHSAPVVAAVVPADTAPAARLLGGLDAKLAEKPWVHEIYSEKAGRIGPEGEGLNPVDVAVDDVIREGIQKLKAKL